MPARMPSRAGRLRRQAIAVLCSSARRVSENWDMGLLRGGGGSRHRARGGMRVSDDGQPSARDAFLHRARRGKISVTQSAERRNRQRGRRRLPASGMEMPASGVEAGAQWELLPEERRPDGPVKVRRMHDKSMSTCRFGIFRYRGINHPCATGPCRRVPPPELGSGRRPGRGGLGSGAGQSGWVDPLPR